MNQENFEWRAIARVEFHLNGGFTKLLTWAGGPHWIDLETDRIPWPLRRMGSWLMLRMSTDGGFAVEGAAEAQEFPWRTELP
jgi:hypothetical protein